MTEVTDVKIRTTRALTLLSMLVALLAGVPHASAVAPSETDVAWPTVTQFNPDNYDYVVGIAYDGPGHIEFRERDDRHQPNWYASEVSFTKMADGFHLHLDGTRRLVIDVVLCQHTQCERFATSPDLTIADQLYVRSGDGFLGPDDSPGVVSPDYPFDVDWSISTKWGEVPLASGTAHNVSTGYLPPIEAHIADGTELVYDAQIQSNDGPYGVLSDDVQLDFTWDTTAPTSGRLVVGSYMSGRNDGDTVYPLPAGGDDYWDDLYFSATVRDPSGLGAADVIFRNAGGEVVRSLRMSRLWDEAAFSWDGTDQDGDLLPEGSYTVETRLYDHAGNYLDLTPRTVHVSHKVFVDRAFVRTVTPAASAVDRSVGRCATLARPARPRWKGSFGYYSDRNCSDPDEWSVATVHNLRVPRGAYGILKLDLLGGAVRGTQPGFVNVVFLNKRGDWGRKYRVDGHVRPHRIKMRNLDTLLHKDGSGPPRLVFAVGNGGGARFDLRSFTVEVRYTALIEP